MTRAHDKDLGHGFAAAVGTGMAMPITQPTAVAVAVTMAMAMPMVTDGHDRSHGQVAALLLIEECSLSIHCRGNTHLRCLDRSSEERQLKKNMVKCQC